MAAPEDGCPSAWACPQSMHAMQSWCHGAEHHAGTRALCNGFHSAHARAPCCFRFPRSPNALVPLVLRSFLSARLPPVAPPAPLPVPVQVPIPDPNPFLLSDPNPGPVDPDSHPLDPAAQLDLRSRHSHRHHDGHSGLAARNEHPPRAAMIDANMHALDINPVCALGSSMRVHSNTLSPSQ